jgi:hypothetical protein
MQAKRLNRHLIPEPAARICTPRSAFSHYLLAPEIAQLAPSVLRLAVLAVRLRLPACSMQVFLLLGKKANPKEAASNLSCVQIGPARYSEAGRGWTGRELVRVSEFTEDVHLCSYCRWFVVVGRG